MSGPISAPTSIDPMVMKLKSLANSLTDEMMALETAYNKLVASGTTGVAVDVLGTAIRMWKNRGFGESGKTMGIATVSTNFKQDVDAMDATWAARFSQA
jgi:hypothetical protein